MFWLFDRKSDCDYVFVYDDVDKSVEYVNYVSLVQAGVEIAGTIKFADMLSTARYRLNKDKLITLLDEYAHNAHYYLLGCRMQTVQKLVREYQFPALTNLYKTENKQK